MSLFFYAYCLRAVTARGEAEPLFHSGKITYLYPEAAEVGGAFIATSTPLLWSLHNQTYLGFLSVRLRLNSAEPCFGRSLMGRSCDGIWDRLIKTINAPTGTIE